MIDDARMQRLEARLGGLLDDGAVSRDAQTRDYLAQDVFTRDKPAGLVLRPANVEQLAAAVAEATAAGCAVIPRGGGMSYSGGYVPAEADSVLLDLRGMNRVLEINRDDMHVSVEAGTSWRELREALAGTGLRTPYWGTLSGIYASVGGSLSQNSIFWGSGHYGSAAESALSLKVVLADGTVLDTGSAGRGNAGPFFRQHGPDLTGLFCGDCGALGVKAAATLRLVPEVEGRAFGAFAFDDYPAMLAAMAEISRQDLAMECFGFDPFLQAQRLRRESLAADAKNLLGVMKSAGGVGKALRDGARIAAAGRGFMEDVAWSFNVMIEDRGTEGAAERLEAARRIAAGEGGRELPDTIPKILR
ncbi:MAG: FAD-binding oxidoreductase, partial [Gammaproteobacteria bacterium]|nr:FAD-binding oxidoreductase [Gammaproteobacteria bacterium]